MALSVEGNCLNNNVQNGFKAPPVTLNMTVLDSDEYDWRRRLSRIKWLAATWQNTTGGGGFVAAAPVTNTDNLSLLCSA